MSQQKLVVIGNGMAPGRALEKLFETSPGLYDVTIFNAEPRVNYDRILLSPVLSGEKAYEDIIIHGDDWYSAHGVTLHKGAKVTTIDRAAKTVTSETGITAAYDKLIIATGSQPFIIPVPGANLAGVLTYRDLMALDRNPDCRIYGVTATPNRGDKIGLRQVFSNVGDQIRLGELIASGHLVPPRTFIIDVGVQDELSGLPRPGLGKARHERGELVMRHGDDDQLAATHDLDGVEDRHARKH